MNMEALTRTQRFLCAIMFHGVKENIDLVQIP